MCLTVPGRDRHAAFAFEDCALLLLPCLRYLVKEDQKASRHKREHAGGMSRRVSEVRTTR